MDLGLTQEQEMLRTSARDFLEKECPKSLVRAMEKDPQGFPQELWRKLAAQGWAGLVAPEEFGGAGMTFLDLCLLLEELGRACAPVPYLSTVLGGLLIATLGSEAQKQSLLPRLAEGHLIVSLALLEADGSCDPASIHLQAAPHGDGLILEGTKLLVPDAHIADLLLVAARAPSGGLTLLLVEPKAPGVTITPLRTIVDDKLFAVSFKGARAPRSSVLGEMGKAGPALSSFLEQAAVAQCALMCGGAQAVVELSVSYAKERVQFGRPIGSFQAIQHMCADMALASDGARFATYYAAWRLSEGLPLDGAASVAKAWASDAYRRITAQGQQVHGAIGFTYDHDMQLYFRRAKAMEVAFGDGDYHRERVAQLLRL